MERHGPWRTLGAAILALLASSCSSTGDRSDTESTSVPKAAYPESSSARPHEQLLGPSLFEGLSGLGRMQLNFSGLEAVGRIGEAISRFRLFDEVDWSKLDFSQLEGAFGPLERLRVEPKPARVPEAPPRRERDHAPR